MLLLILGVALVTAAFGLLAHAIALPRLRTAERLAAIDAYGYPAEAEEDGEGQSGLAGSIDRLARRLGAAAMPRVGESGPELRVLLLSAGAYGVGAEAFLGYRLLGAIVLPLAWLWLGATSGAGGALVLLGALLAALVGWRLPLVVLERRAKGRLSAIDYELPELIDSLVVTVEAGLGLGAALRMAANELKGPLGAEISLSLREQSMGLSSEEALENLAGRVDTAAMRGFVRAVLQGERLGVSIGDIMRSLAVEARARRRADAEERAHKAPVKLLFPLVFLIFPSIMIVLLYPALHNISQALGNH
jgi:tight adherence protein C